MLIGIATALKELRLDHDNVRMLLGLVDSEIAHFVAGPEPDWELLRDAAQYLTVYADAVHHPREDLLFGRIATADEGVARDLARLASEHHDLAIRGATLRSDINSVLAEAPMPRQQLIDDLRRYTTLLKRHMQFEDEGVFRRAEEYALRHDDPAIDVSARLAGRDPLFGAVKASEFANLLAHLRARTRAGPPA